MGSCGTCVVSKMVGCALGFVTPGLQRSSVCSVFMPVCIGEHVAERIAFRNVLYNCFKSSSGVLC